LLAEISIYTLILTIESVVSFTRSLAMKAALTAVFLMFSLFLQSANSAPLYYHFNTLWMQQNMPEYSAYQLERYGRTLLPSYNVTPEERDFVARFEHRQLMNQCAAAPVTTRVHPHYPGFKSGCTHGFGYDMGVRRQSRTYRDLQTVLRADRAKFCAKAYSTSPLESLYAKRRKKALNYCPLSHEDDVCSLNCAQSFNLLDQQIEKAKRRILERAHKDGIVLSAQQLQALISLDYNNPVFVSGSTKLWRYLAQEDHEQVARQILRNSGSQKVRLLQNRRNREALIYLLGSGYEYTEARHIVKKHKR
jgi:hypothetical protein